MANQQNGGSKKLWGGRFSEATAASVEAFSSSIDYDSRLYKYDIAGSKAHAEALAANGVLTQDELTAIVTGLTEIENEIESGSFVFKPELEDIHMNIEKALIDRIGPAGAKLHSGRSRNDQVAVDFKLYLRDQCDALVGLLDDIRRAFVVLSRKYIGRVMPGYTHMQRAQPVQISHHMLAYYEMFSRDRDRIIDCRKRLNLSPLGCAAMAGTGLPVDRMRTSAALGFSGVTANSIDTSGDRDYAIEFASCCTLIQLHLSRLSEELVLWSTEEFNFVNISDKFCTGSSIMPQKKNPDIPELIRGKSGRVVGSLMSLITLMKGLPLTYNRDMQEDKEPVFDAVDTVSASLAIMAELLGNLSFNTEVLAKATESGCMTATDLADYLVMKNVPFREAHGIVGRAVAYCLDNSKELADLSLEELKQFSGEIESDVFAVLSVEGSVNSRNSIGGTGFKRVEEAVTVAEKQVGIG
ncbi:argininosuccinate lyase [Desulforhopalus singaporensis]|uniref:Argininosuccinate lyase n=1 Tax=Desulforhopalus singaporensis TaxID=91360 RepID=A0A1H0TU28_9BACT|nr:argininosuccinate lyase [Desulforhopalus singaporensis]SDP57443.1 argininosuccinate lyase [Desulforhopalus singaporensis]